jgi:hypothetical protein
MIRRVIRERQWMLHSPEMPEWIAGLRFAMRESPSPPLPWGRIALTVFCPKPRLRQLRLCGSGHVRDA